MANGQNRPELDKCGEKEMANSTPGPKRRGKGKKTLAMQAQALQGVIVRVKPIKLQTLRDIRTEVGKLYREARCGLIDSQDATRLSYILGELRQIIVNGEFEERLRVLEDRQNGKY